MSQTEPCPGIGSEVASFFGDVDCDDDVDALKILRFVVGLSVSQTEPCPDIGVGLEATAGAAAGLGALRSFWMLPVSLLGLAILGGSRRLSKWRRR